MVVTASYSDGSSAVISDGYTVSEVDFSTAGTKTVTVTYEGKSDSFSINVELAKPTDWSDADYALFEQYLGGYEVPFFYGPDLGFGDLTWAYDSNTDTLAVTGTGNINVADKADSFQAIFALLDDFEVTAEPSGSTYNYSLAAEFLDDNYIYNVFEIQTGAYRSSRYRANNAPFRLEISYTPYFTAWEDTGLEEALQDYYGFTADMPDFPDGALYSINDLQNYTALSMQYGYDEVPLYMVSEDTYPEDLAYEYYVAGWVVQVPEEDTYYVISPTGDISFEIAYSTAYGETWVTFQPAPAVPEYVVAVADMFDISPYYFEESDSGSWIIQLNEGLMEGETGLEDIFDRYADYFEENDFEIRGSVDGDADDEEAYIRGYAYNDDLSAKVLLYVGVEFGETADEDDYFVYLAISEFEPYSQDIINFCSVIGEDPYNIMTDSNSGELFLDVIPEGQDGSQTPAEILQAFLGLLDADAALETPVAGFTAPDGLQAGDDYYYVDYVNGGEGATLARIYFFAYEVSDAGTPDDDSDDFAIWMFEIIFMTYHPPVENSWLDELEAALGFEFNWDNDEQLYFIQEAITIGEGESYQTYAADFAATFMEADDSLQLLSQSGQTGSYYQIVLFAEEGYITIQAFKSTNGKDYLVALVSFFAHPEYDLMVNAISAAIDVPLEYDDEFDIYVGYSENVNAGLSLTRYGQTIATGYSEGKYLTAASLGFKFSSTDSGYDSEEDVYIATFTNDEGYIVEMDLIGDGSGNFTGEILIVVYAPAE